MLILRTLAAFFLAASSTAYAQDYPTRPLTLIVPFSAGGGADMVGRILAQKLTASLGQSVVVENRPGAGGNIGAEAVARAAPDGYTLLLTSSAFVINPSLYAKISYDPLKDFRPISQPALLPNVLVVPTALPVKSVAELVAYAKAHPLSYASAGVGTGTHLAGEMFKLATHLDLVHVPYKGGGAVTTDLLAGRVALSFATLPSVIQYVQEGRMRALAMTTDVRWAGLPDVPTMQQAGFKDFDISTWIGLLAPAGTPDAVVEKLHREVARIVQEPDVRERFVTLGMMPVGDSSAEFGAQIRRQLAMYKELVKASGAKLD
ncbi:MAG TPA: tripartite tricarboxylate transporter substrate binding protein [Bordetella sp.]|nr:tripartite tricarboxylate transporter substrate binding protein [Bordetella sp.]